ncbi:MAG: hypothetical protein VB100_09120, partial [Angelakisella sp.]|nr:hypothetical protein [Angelakisella sp.]
AVTSGVAFAGVGVSGLALAADSPKMWCVGQDLITWGNEAAAWLWSDIHTNSAAAEMKIVEPHGADFIVTKGGDNIIIPKGATGPMPTNNGKGFIFEGGSGGHGLDSRVTSVRIMGPTLPNHASPGYPGGYVVYMNSTEQRVDFLGHTVAKSSYFGHIPINLIK